MDFGSPRAKDGTAKREARIIKYAKRRVERLNRFAEILNRPIGSKPGLSEEEERLDWEMQIQNPQVLAQRFTERAQVIGPAKAELELLQWDADMRKKAG